MSDSSSTPLPSRSAPDQPSPRKNASTPGREIASTDYVALYHIEREARLQAERKLELASRADEMSACAAGIVEASEDAIIGCTLDGEVTFWNRGAERLYGYCSCEALGLSFSALLARGGSDELPTMVRQLRQGVSSEAREMAHVRKDGTRLWVSASISPIENAAAKLSGFSVIARDITTRRRVMVEWRESERRLRQMADAMPLFIWTAGADGQVSHFNRGWADYVGVPFEPEGGVAWRGIHPDDQQRTANAWKQAVETGQPYECEHRICRHDGAYRWHLSRGIPITDEEGHVVHWYGSTIDVHDQKSAQEKIWQANAEMRSLLAHAPIGLAFFDRDGRYLHVNRRLAQNDGIPVAAHLGRAIRDVLPVNATTMQPIIERVFATGEAVADLQMSGETPLKPGEQRHWLTNFYPVFGSEGSITAVGVTVMEITDRVRAEQTIADLNVRLQRAMAETHHRVKNNLQVIAALIEMQTGAHEGAVPTTEVRGLSQHVRGLAAIHDLLTEQCKAGNGADMLSAQAALRQLLPLLQATLNGRLIQADLADISIPTKQATALSIIANELVANAIKHARGNIALILEADGNQARLVVEDDGPGFPADFDAERAARTGLDLVVNLSSWDLAGESVFENRPDGSGARVVVTFPITEPPVESAL